MSRENTDKIETQDTSRTELLSQATIMETYQKKLVLSVNELAGKGPKW